MMTDEYATLVYVVDDDDSVRLSLVMLLESARMDVMAFRSAKEFLESEIREESACLVTDIKMQGVSGLELQQKMNERGIRVPIIFLTAFDSSDTREKARQGGAVSFFRKPVDDLALIDAINWAVGGNY